MWTRRWQSVRGSNVDTYVLGEEDDSGIPFWLSYARCRSPDADANSNRTITPPPFLRWFAVRASFDPPFYPPLPAPRIHLVTRLPPPSSSHFRRLFIPLIVVVAILLPLLLLFILLTFPLECDS